MGFLWGGSSSSTSSPKPQRHLRQRADIVVLLPLGAPQPPGPVVGEIPSPKSKNAVRSNNYNANNNNYNNAANSNSNSNSNNGSTYFSSNQNGGSSSSSNSNNGSSSSSITNFWKNRNNNNGSSSSNYSGNTSQESRNTMQSSTNSDGSSSTSSSPATTSILATNGNPQVVWSYLGFLGFGLCAWVLFLILPKGMRKAYCRSDRKRFTRRTMRTNWRDDLTSIANGTSAQDDDDDSSEDSDDILVSTQSILYNNHKQAPTSSQSQYSRNHNPYSYNNNTISPKPSQDYSVQDSILLATEERRKQTIHDVPMSTTTRYQDYPAQQRMDSGVTRMRSSDALEHTYHDQVDDGDTHQDDDEEDSLHLIPMSIAANESAMLAHQTPSPQTKQLYGKNHQNYSRNATNMPSAQNLFGKQTPEPSPFHPQIRQIPEERIWRESLRRLQSRGVRLTAHGVQCDAKRIWLNYSSDDKSLQWQTEFPRQMKNEQTGANSIVLMRGAMHKIPLANVLYIDVGKKTSALQKTSAMVPPSACFSLLTQQGSLDLQTNSKLERDAVVSSLCYLLDQVHVSADWRRLYQDSNAGTPSEIGSSAISSELFAGGGPTNADI